MRTRIEFPSGGHTLRGLLEHPPGEAAAYALFAHCFTCGKDIAAASRIARALTRRGIAVLRFDFTGLGSSDGDFANTNFSSNIQDLLAAVDYLRSAYRAPELLIGHSLGGAAVLAMAAAVPEARAVVTIAAPGSAGHVVRHFGAALDEIAREGEAEVTLGPRRFRIRKQFLDDLERYAVSEGGLPGKALLVMHSPLDTTVDIAEAEKIYSAARHPKSFVSLDTADHLLSDKRDARYAAEVIAAWAGRYLPPAPSVDAVDTLAQGHVRVEEIRRPFTNRVTTDGHNWLADEPRALGGNDSGPDPYEHLLAGLGACTSMTLRMYAERKGWPLEQVSVTLSHSRDHRADCEHCEDPHAAMELIERRVRLHGALSDAQRERLLEIANKCPVHRTLHGPLAIHTLLAEDQKV